MYNKNGFLLANTIGLNLSLASRSLFDISGTEISSGTIASNEYKVAIFDLNSIGSGVVYAKDANFSTSIGSLYVSAGYREAPPSDETYVPVFAGDALSLNYPGSGIFKVVTLTNTSDSDIDINEIDCILYDSGTQKKYLYAVYPIDKVTLSGAESIAFSFMH